MLEQGGVCLFIWGSESLFDLFTTFCELPRVGRTALLRRNTQEKIVDESKEGGANCKTHIAPTALWVWALNWAV